MGPGEDASRWDLDVMDHREFPAGWGLLHQSVCAHTRPPNRLSASMTPKDEPARLLARYDRVKKQLQDLFTTVTDPVSRMASAAALVHGKMPHHSWTGFYRRDGADLLVGPYQGPLACMLLERGVGACWACCAQERAIVVPDVRSFEGHIACDPRTRSEVALPVRDSDGVVCAVLDVDSTRLDAFSDADVQGLKIIAALIYA